MLTRKFTSKVAKNLGRVLTDKLFQYRNIIIEVTNNSETHAYITFIDTTPIDPKDICRINIYENMYAISGHIINDTLYFTPRNTISDRLRIYRCLDKAIRDYRKGIL